MNMQSRIGKLEQAMLPKVRCTHRITINTEGEEPQDVSPPCDCGGEHMTIWVVKPESVKSDD